MAGAPNDDAVARLLRRSLASDTASPGEACPDAEILSAFADRALSDDEARDVERHIASCATCTRIVAMVAASEPAVASASTPRRPWAWWRWAMPIATAATVAALWVATRNPERRRADSGDSMTVPRTVTAAPPKSKPESPSAAASGRASTPAVSEEKSAERRASTRSAREQSSGNEQPAETSAQAQAAQSDTPSFRRIAPPAAPPSRVEGAPLPQPPAVAATQVAPPVPAATPPPPQPPLAEAVTPVPTLIVSSPLPAIQWRVFGSTVERTVNGGATWTTEYTADRNVIAGAAVNRDVVWLVGARGLVLRRTASGWTTVKAPTNGDLRKVEPAGTAEATVEAANGAAFHTADGGLTWTGR